MVLNVPHYYKHFQCIAAACKDNCCIGGWEIDIDDETVKYYRTVPGPFGERLQAAICETDSYCFQLRDGRCPFLDHNNLCEIYQRLGADKLGVVCTQFPRFSEYFGGVKETGIGLACEEAARIILYDKARFSLESMPLDEEETQDSEYDEQLGQVLLQYRDRLFSYVESEEGAVADQLIQMLESSYAIQIYINDNDYEGIEQYLRQLSLGSEHIGSVSAEPFGGSPEEGVSRIITAYTELEAINDRWIQEIHCVQDILHKAETDYDTVSKEYAVDVKAFEYQFKNLIKYYIFRYLLKAAYDHDLFGKIQLIVSNYLVLRDMDLYYWLIGGKRLDLNNREEIVHIFSREVEYSEDNLWALAEAFLFDDIFSIASLVRLLDLLKI